MSYRIVLLALCLVACGGTGTPQTADDAVTEVEQEAASEQAEEEGETSEIGAPSKAGAASAADIQAVLQLVIDDEALSPYLHLEQPDRFPLRVSAKNVPQGIELVKATKPVVIVAESEAGDKPVLEFTAIEASGDSASVRYRYDVEGVRGSCSLVKRDGRWELQSSRVTER
jgi:hypothetical protein